MDLTNELQQILTSYKGGVLLGFSALFFLLVKILRGQVVGNIPYVTEWFESLSKQIKTIIVISVCSISGVLTTITTVSPITLWDVLSGLVSGLSIASTTLGIRQIYKQATGTDQPVQPQP